MRSIIPAILLSGTTAILFCSFGNDNGCKKENQSLTDYLHWKAGATAPIIMAHRLSPNVTEPENALSTFEKTWKKYPCAIQEMDVRMSRDGELFLLHDSTLDRTTTGQGPISQMPSADIKQLKLKDGNGKVLAEAIPTFAEMLQLAKGKSILALDIKPGTDIEKVMAVVQQENMEQQVFAIIYTLPDAVRFSKTYPDIMMAIGFNSWEHIAAIKKSGLPYNRLIALTPQQLQPKAFYDTIHAMGVMVSASAFGQMDRLPADSLATNYKAIFATGGDIICTDSMHNVIAAFQ